MISKETVLLRGTARSAQLSSEIMPWMIAGKKEGT